MSNKINMIGRCKLLYTLELIKDRVTSREIYSQIQTQELIQKGLIILQKKPRNLGNEGSQRDDCCTGKQNTGMK